MLSRAKLVFLFFVALIMAANLRSAEQFLERFEWENRVILIRAEIEDRRESMNQIAAQRAAIEEHHILWFLFAGELIETNYEGKLPENFALRIGEAGYWQEAETVLLIGKDGGIKARQESLDLEALFRRIDSMPMRRAEMRAEDGNSLTNRY